MEEFKLFDELLKRDTRWEALNPSGSNISLECFYLSVADINLDESIPEELRSRFNTIKNMTVYTYLDYAFCMAVELQCYSLLEWSLRIKAEMENLPLQNNPSFKALMDKAMSEGWIDDSAFSNINYDPAEPLKYCGKVFDIVRRFRNDLAHGSPSLLSGFTFTLKWTSEFINKLFNEDKN